MSVLNSVRLSIFYKLYMKKTPVLLAILSLFIASQTAMAAISMSFSDVNSQTGYFTAINWAVQNQVATGFPDGTWRPDACVNRAELVKMVMEARGQDGPQTTTYKTPFPDIKKSDWFYKYANDAKAAGFIRGYADGFFRGYQCVNRAEAMKIAVNVLFANPPVTTGSGPLYYDDKMVVDITYADWYMPYARFLFADRLIGTDHTGYAGTTTDTVPPIRKIYFYPAGDMSRKEVAQMLYLITHSTKYTDIVGY